MAEERREVSKLFQVSSGLSGVLACLIFFLYYRVIPDFKETFVSFDVDLPSLTSLAINFYELFLIMSIASLLSGLYAWVSKTTHAAVLPLSLLAVSLVFAPILIIAMYLPVYAL